MKDKRDYIRYNVFLETEDRIMCTWRSATIDINDISCSGLGISVKERLTPGDDLELELSVPKDDIPMFIMGEVAWSAKDVDVPELYRAGIRITRISSSDKERLLKYILSNFISSEPWAS